VSRRYTGQVLDDATGLYYYNARYYDPVLGRFTQPDDIIPDIFNPQSYNRYSYVLNNPLRYTDPSGHDEDDITDVPLGMTLGASHANARHTEGGDSARLYTQSGGDLKTVASVGREIAEVNPLVGGYNGFSGAIKGEDAVLYNKLTPGERLKSGGGGVLATSPAVLKLAGKVVKAGEMAVAAKSINLPSLKKITIDIEHIASGHMEGGARVSSKKTLFPGSWSKDTVEKAVKEAYGSAKKVETQGERVRLQGTGGGQKIEIWLNTQSKTIETAYPIK